MGMMHRENKDVRLQNQTEVVVLMIPLIIFSTIEVYYS